MNDVYIVTYSNIRNGTEEERCSPNSDCEVCRLDRMAEHIVSSLHLQKQTQSWVVRHEAMSIVETSV